MHSARRASCQDIPIPEEEEICFEGSADEDYDEEYASGTDASEGMPMDKTDTLNSVISKHSVYSRDSVRESVESLGLSAHDLAERAKDHLQGPRNLVKLRAVYQEARTSVGHAKEQEPSKFTLAEVAKFMFEAVKHFDGNEQVVEALSQLAGHADDHLRLKKGLLTVRILAAHNLQETWGDHPNAYVLLHLGPNTFRTTTCQSRDNPEWNRGHDRRQFSLIVRPEETHRTLTLEVVSDGFGQETDISLGCCELDVHTLPWDEWQLRTLPLLEDGEQVVEGAELVFEIRLARDTVTKDLDTDEADFGNAWSSQTENGTKHKPRHKHAARRKATQPGWVNRLLGQSTDFSHQSAQQTLLSEHGDGGTGVGRGLQKGLSKGSRVIPFGSSSSRFFDGMKPGSLEQKSESAHRGLHRRTSDTGQESKLSSSIKHRAIHGNALHAHEQAIDFGTGPKETSPDKAWSRKHRMPLPQLPITQHLHQEHTHNDCLELGLPTEVAGKRRLSLAGNTRFAASFDKAVRKRASVDRAVSQIADSEKANGIRGQVSRIQELCTSLGSRVEHIEQIRSDKEQVEQVGRVSLEDVKRQLSAAQGKEADGVGALEAAVQRLEQNTSVQAEREKSLAMDKNVVKAALSALPITEAIGHIQSSVLNPCGPQLSDAAMLERLRSGEMSSLERQRLQKLPIRNAHRTDTLHSSPTPRQGTQSAKADVQAGLRSREIQAKADVQAGHPSREIQPAKADVQTGHPCSDAKIQPAEADVQTGHQSTDVQSTYSSTDVKIPGEILGTSGQQSKASTIDRLRTGVKHVAMIERIRRCALFGQDSFELHEADNVDGVMKHPNDVMEQSLDILAMSEALCGGLSKAPAVTQHSVADKPLSRPLVSKFKKAGRILGRIATVAAAHTIDPDLSELVKKEISEMAEEHTTVVERLLELMGSTNATAIQDALQKVYCAELVGQNPEIGGLVSALEWRRECLTGRPGQMPDAKLQKQAWKRGRNVALSQYRAQRRKLKYISGSSNIGEVVAVPKAPKDSALSKFRAAAKQVKAEQTAINSFGQWKSQPASEKCAPSKLRKAGVVKGTGPAIDLEHRSILEGAHDRLVALSMEEDVAHAQTAADMAELRAAQHELENMLRDADPSLGGASELVPDELIDAATALLTRGNSKGQRDTLVETLQETLANVKVKPATRFEGPMPEDAMECLGAHCASSGDSKQSFSAVSESEGGEIFGAVLQKHHDVEAPHEKWNCRPWELSSVLQQEGWPRELAKPLQRLALTRKRQQESKRPAWLHRRLLPGPIVQTESDPFSPTSSLFQSSSSFWQSSIASSSSMQRPQTTPSSSIQDSVRMLMACPSSALLSRHPSPPSGEQSTAALESVPLQGISGWVVSRSAHESSRCRTAPSGTRTLPPMSLLQAPLRPKTAREMEEEILQELASSAARHISAWKSPLPKEFEGLFFDAKHEGDRQDETSWLQV